MLLPAQLLPACPHDGVVLAGFGYFARLGTGGNNVDFPCVSLCHVYLYALMELTLSVDHLESAYLS